MNKPTLGSWINAVNGTLFIFLIIAMVCNIVLGTMMYRFSKESDRRHEESVKERQTLIHDDSSFEKHQDVMLQDHIDIKNLLTEIIKNQNDSTKKKLKHLK